jgi:hypothetical protein
MNDQKTFDAELIQKELTQWWKKHEPYYGAIVRDLHLWFPERQVAQGFLDVITQPFFDTWGITRQEWIREHCRLQANDWPQRVEEYKKCMKM